MPDNFERLVALLEQQSVLVENLMNRVYSLELHYKDLVARQQDLIDQGNDRFRRLGEEIDDLHRIIAGKNT